MLQSLTSDTAPQRSETWLRADLLFLRDALARGMCSGRLRPKRSSLASHQIELLNFVCGAIAVVDASDVSNFAQTPDGQGRNANTNRYAIPKRSAFISTC
jgi:hypothetical protein